jgi:hypothetical protein
MCLAASFRALRSMRAMRRSIAARCTAIRERRVRAIRAHCALHARHHGANPSLDRPARANAASAPVVGLSFPHREHVLNP